MTHLLKSRCLTAKQRERLANNTLLPWEIAGIEAHMDQCDQCCHLLEATSLDERWRDDVLPGLMGSLDESHRPSVDALPIQSILDLMGPTDDPEMLGRIANYEVAGVIGRGGMGVVFKALDRGLNRYVAIKMLSPHLAASGAARVRFQREAQAAAAVIDDHVLPIYSVSQWNEVPYLVMQYLRGETLQKRIYSSGPLELREILRIGMQTARGLAAAHAQGLVHRDVKPSNILLDGSVSRAMLTDFGLARAVDDASMTTTGVVAGTPQYMSPEQARAESIDQRSDLFSLGSVLYAMCTGQAPFRAESSLAVLRLITDKQPLPIREVNPDIPEWLCAIIHKLMEKQPADRFDSADQVAEVLEECLAHVQQPLSCSLPSEVLDITALASAPAHEPGPRVMNQLKAGFRRISMIGGSIIAAVFALSLVLAGTIVVLELDKGTLTIESEQDGVPIRIVQGDKTVKQMVVSIPGATTRLHAGKYTIKIEGEHSMLKLENGQLTLRQGESSVVSIKFKSEGQADWANQHVDKHQDASSEKPVPNKLIGPTTDIVSKFDGTWLVEKQEPNDVSGMREVLRPERMLFIVEGNAWTCWENEQYPCTNLTAVYQTDSSPQRVSLSIPGAEKSQQQSGLSWKLIAKRTDDELLLCVDPSGSSFPTIFESSEDGSRVLYSLRRQTEAQPEEQFGIGGISPEFESSGNLQRPLKSIIDHFNQTQIGDQPPLTVDEILTCLSWKLQSDPKLAELVRTSLSPLFVGRELPRPWSLTGGTVQLEADEGAVESFQIRLENEQSKESILIRSRYLDPPELFKKPRQHPNPGEIPLTAAIFEFNKNHFQVDGVPQAPLTLNEVIAAVVHWQAIRDEAAVDDQTFSEFQQIRNTHSLPKDAKIEVVCDYPSREGMNVFHTWSIRIALPRFADRTSAYAFTIREQFLNSDAFNSTKIYWGEANEAGLQAGLRLNPSQRELCIGDKIQVEIFYRNIYGRSFFAPDVGTVVAYRPLVRELHRESKLSTELSYPLNYGETGVRVGEGPVMRYGRPFVLVSIDDSERVPDEDEELILRVAPGHQGMLKLQVADLSSGLALHTDKDIFIETGEVYFSVVEASKAAKKTSKSTGSSSTKSNSSSLEVDLLLQGRWKMHQVFDRGNLLSLEETQARFERLGKSDHKDHRLVFKGSHYDEYLNGQLASSGRWQTDSKSQPYLLRQVSEVWTDELPFRIRMRVFQVDGDTLRFHEEILGGQMGERVIPEADDSVIYEFKREPEPEPIP